MIIRMPAEQLFEPGSIVVRDDREDLMYRVSRALSRRVAGLRYEVEFSTFTGPFIGGESGGGQIIEVARAGAFARALLDRGARLNSLTIGAQPGNPGEVELAFFIRIEGQAQLDFAE